MRNRFVVVLLLCLSAPAAGDPPELGISQPWKFRLSFGEPAKAASAGLGWSLIADGDVLITTEFSKGGPEPTHLVQATRCGTDGSGWQPIKPAPQGDIEGLIATAKGPLVWTAGGMYRRDRGKKQWTKVGQGIGKLTSDIMSGGTTLFAMSGKSLYRSVDAGVRWKAVGKVPDRGATLLAVIGDHAYLDVAQDATHPQSLVKMSANGKSTTVRETPIKKAVAMGPHFVLYTGSTWETSADGGATWQPIQNFHGSSSHWTGTRAIANGAGSSLLTTTAGAPWTGLARDGLLQEGSGGPVTTLRNITSCGADLILMDGDRYGLFALPIAAIGGTGGPPVADSQTSTWVRAAVGAKDEWFFDLWGPGPGSASVYAASTAGLHQSDDGGTTWRSSLPGTFARAIWGSSKKDVYVVGQGIHHSSDGGKSWKELAAPLIATLTKEFPDLLMNAVWGIGTHVYVVGGNGVVLHSADRGARWERINIGSTAHLVSVGGNKQAVFVAGYHSKGGLLTASRDGGATWQPVDTGTTTSLLSVWSSGDADVYVGGEFGTLLRSRSDGAWTNIALPVEQRVEAIFGSSSKDFYCLVQHKTLLHTRDGGTTWVVENVFDSGEVLGALWGTSKGLFVAGKLGVLRSVPAKK